MTEKQQGMPSLTQFLATPHDLFREEMERDCKKKNKETSDARHLNLQLSITFVFRFKLTFIGMSTAGNVQFYLYANVHSSRTFTYYNCTFVGRLWANIGLRNVFVCVRARACVC